jgi:plastocyanin
MSAIGHVRSQAAVSAALGVAVPRGPLSAMGRLPKRGLLASALRITLFPLVCFLAGCGTSPHPVAQSTVPAAGASVTVVLADFSFSPSHLTLRAGVPIRLRLVNQSGGGHDFSAPKFFAASSFPAGSAAPPDGAVEVGSHQTVELALTPRDPGTYPVVCTHFLHELFGMTATIDVVS